MKTQTQALDTLFHGKAIRLQSVYCFYIYVITSVSRRYNEPNIFCFKLCSLRIKAKKKKRKGKMNAYLALTFSSVTLLFPISLLWRGS